MEGKLYYYDVMGVLVPGVLAIAGTMFFLHWAGISVSVPALPAGVEFAVFLVAALFSGHVVQALGSLLEPVYYWTWRGKPSAVLLAGRRSFKGFGPSDGRRIREAISGWMAVSADNKEPAGSSVFSYAMAIVNRQGIERVKIFNALYAYHRGLLTCSLYLTLAAGVFALLDRFSWVSFFVMLPVLLLFWHRAKQRGYYYAREVLQMAEQEIAECRKEQSWPKKDT